MSDLPDKLQKRLEACRTLPTVPAVALQILNLCQDEEVGIGKISRVLAGDPALCAEVLKFANSASYGARCQVTTLERAVTLLGINATLSLSLSFSFVRGLRKHDKTGFDHNSFWRRSAVTGEAARVIGTWAKAASRDELFLAGLLQDIGMLALNESMPELYGPVIAAARGNHELLVEIEQETLGTNHAAVGAWLLKKWNLPDNLRLAVASSHNLQGVSSEKHDLFIRSAALASAVAGIWTNPQTAESTARAREASVLLFDMPQDWFRGLLDEIAVTLPESTSTLDIEIGSEETLNLLLDQAREALVMLSLHAQQRAQEVEQQAQQDPLTSLFNRTHLDKVLPRYFSMAQKSSQPLSVLFLDIDHFKSVNDSFGHQAGDRVLVATARVLRSGLRGPDIVGRYGGEEFVCLLPNTPQEGAALVAERLRAAIAAQSCEISSDLKITVTVSVGCATMSDDREFAGVDELVRAADKCLYAAKNGGRNKVVSLEALPTEEAVA